MQRNRKRKLIERETNNNSIDERHNKNRKKRKISTSKQKPTRKSARLANKKKLFEDNSLFNCNNLLLFDNNAHLFDKSCLYSFLEVFLIGYKEIIRNDLWEWLWIWEQKASAFYRILIIPIYEHNLFEIRVDSIHGLECGLLSEFLLKDLIFEYYYSYSRSNIWGGWKFCYNKKIIKHDIYGNIFNNIKQSIIQPSKIWKQIIWFKQLKMELMYKKYGGINMNKMHLTHYFYGHHKFNQIDGNHNIYINNFPPYQINKKNKSITKTKTKTKTKKKDKFNIYNYQMAQIFDKLWCKTHQINDNSIKLNVDDLSLILGTKEKMRCAQCYQTFPICRAIKLCQCFKGCFVVKDLYQRHKSMVIDWK